MRFRRCVGMVVSVATTAVFVACGGGDGGTNPTPTIQVAASPSALTLVQGQSGTVQLTLARSGGFTGAVNVAASGVPEGVTATINPASLTGSTTAATVTVSSAVNTVPGIYAVTVSASGSGVTQVSAPFQLTITAAPSFTLVTTPAALSVNAGGSVNTSIAITRSNVPGAIALSLDTPPAGISGVFTPTSPTADVAQLTISTTSALAPGAYTVTVKGSAVGATDRTTTVALTVGAVPNFALTAAPSPVAIVAGASGMSTITITRTNFAGDVALELVSPPAGVTASFAPATTTGNTSVATVNVAASVAPGSYALTVQGTAPGPGNKTTTLQITVTAAADFALVASPTGISVTAGANGTTTVTISRTNFTGAITLALSGPPAGITATFAPNATLTNASVATVVVANSVAVGTYDLVVQGSGFSVGARTTTLRVTVVAAPSPTLVDFAVCSEPFSQLVWVAFRDGNGPWTRVTPTTSNGVTRVAFSISAATAAVAYTIAASPAAIRSAQRAPVQAASQGVLPRTVHTVTAGGSSRNDGAALVYVTTQAHFLKSEVAQYANCTAITTGSALNATVSGLPAGDNARVTSVAGGSPFFTSATPTRTLDQPAGAQDFWTVRQNANGTSIFSDLQRGLNVPGALIVNALTMAPATTATVTLTGLPAGGAVSDEMELSTSRGRIGPVVINGTQADASRRIIAHPTSQASDMYGYTYSVAGQVGAISQVYTGTYYFGPTVANRTIAVHPSAPAWTTTTIATAPFSRLRSTGAIPSEYNRLVAVTYGGAGFPSNSRIVMATGGWVAAQGSSTSYDLSMDDLSAAQWPTVAALAAPAYTARLMLTGSNFFLQPLAGSYTITVVRSPVN